jgi:hypothetical protein
VASLAAKPPSCVANPQGELKRTFDFLGLDDGYVPPHLGDFVNRTAGDKIALSGKQRQWLSRLYGDDVAALAANVDDIDPELWAGA